MFAATGVTKVMDVILVFSLYSCFIALSNISKTCFYSVSVEQTVPFSKFRCVVSDRTCVLLSHVCLLVLLSLFGPRASSR